MVVLGVVDWVWTRKEPVLGQEGVCEIEDFQLTGNSLVVHVVRGDVAREEYQVELLLPRCRVFQHVFQGAGRHVAFANGPCNQSTLDIVEDSQTRRERLKSALYLRLKKRKTFFWKKLEIFENFSLSENVAQ